LQASLPEVLLVAAPDGVGVAGVIDPGHVEVQSGPLLFSPLFSLLRDPLWKRTGFESKLSIAMEYKLNNISFPLFRFLQYLFLSYYRQMG
jgi:hypothetical protein